MLEDELARRLFTDVIGGIAFCHALGIYHRDLKLENLMLSNADPETMTVKIADDLLGSRGGDWGILAAAAFVSIAVPLLVFFAMQKYLVRGLLAGSVK